jgi:flagellar basal body-associated protein FliL
MHHLMIMKLGYNDSEGFSNIKNKQTQIHMIALIASIIVLVLGLIALPYMIYAQNTNSTPSNATVAESHTMNTTGTPLNATTSTAPRSMGSHISV